MKYSLVQIIGWLGMLLILAAYFFVSFDLLLPDSIWYQGMNIVGSAGIIAVAFTKKDWQPMVLNIVWILIAIVAILRII